MDTMMVDGKLTAYYKNNNPYAKDGNYAEAFKILAPHWHLLKKNMNEVIITRKVDDGVQTLGEIQVGNWVRKTLERPWQNNLPNISCIPKGTYQCRYSFSPKFLKYTYEILNVPKRSGIRIHSGNYFFQIQGCILLGTSYSDINKDGKVDVLNSKSTINALEALLGKKPFTLVIQ
jgi:hypothetical protein